MQDERELSRKQAGRQFCVTCGRSVPFVACFHQEAEYEKDIREQCSFVRMSLALVQGMATVVVQSALKFRSRPSLLALVAHLDCGQAPKSQRIPVRSRACGILEECVCVCACEFPTSFTASGCVCFQTDLECRSSLGTVIGRSSAKQSGTTSPSLSGWPSSSQRPVRLSRWCLAISRSVLASSHPAKSY